MTSNIDAWPSLPLEAWSDTYATLHLWLQIAGKVRLRQTPWINHSWHVTLYVTSRGFTTSFIPHGSRAFAIDFDFIDHRVIVRSSDGAVGGRAARASVGGHLLPSSDERAGEARSSREDPHEAERSRRPIRFEQDEVHRAYDRDYANRFWRIHAAGGPRLQAVPRAVHRQVQPGAPVLGRSRPRGHPVLRTASARASRWRPESARLGRARGVLTRGEQLRILAWWRADPVCVLLRLRLSRSRPAFRQRRSSPRRRSTATTSASSSCLTTPSANAKSPDDMLLDFLQTTYEAAADLARWDREALERGNSEIADS